ncbi:endolytic transglycosylase MltG [Bacteriovorax sp. Seq25_V]|uniref:endolytic transglycosylase MltG n=1 Tax=Bacteriovorax sp. Seq25_V TaxID=1201288 RepID=UPI000389FED5|nr:endolytic transglycosylase MltG [Bacteriovorax sp. Seq25_V]EQC47570.1 YceG family protein [Bacteriovorax sp. Seq25_V]
MSKKNLFIFLFLAPAFALILSVIHIYYGIYVWEFKGPTTTFEIKPGDSFGPINFRLADNKMIYSARLFHRYSKFSQKLTSFKAGVYEVEQGLTMSGVLELLTSGRSITTKVTIPEGKNLFEVAKILEEAKIIASADEFIRLAKNENFVKSLGLNAQRIEGYLYPDTYNFTPNSTPKFVIESMYNVFQAKTADLDFSKTNLSKFEVITLASIVEKETGAKFERPRIAGVFHNRLAKRMRLQSDPTTIYGIYENYNGNLRKKDLLEKTPYNTYKIPALPIGPISNPGIESIKAVLEPEQHQFLYFVSKNDGTHIFSKSYKDHNEAVKTWQINRKNRAGKSWRDLKQ